jgi:putative transposase
VILGVYRQVHIKENTPMAIEESALSELLDAIKVGESTDLVRAVVEWGMQALIEAEATAETGAARYERSESRVAERNGNRPRVLTTAAGDVCLAIRELTKGSFFPSVLEP